MFTMDLVTLNEVERLFTQFVESAFRASETSPLIDSVHNNCEALFAKDYKYCTINNCNGDLSATYPCRIVLLEGEKLKNDQGVSENFRLYRKYDPNKVKSLMAKARVSRCRTRFPVPVILYEGKNICRSATISSKKETIARKVFDYLGAPFQGTAENSECERCKKFHTTPQDHLLNDVRLLEEFSVGYICDLMVEKAKVKFGVYISSSEKIEEDSYKNFKILCLPYPGCEFFSDFQSNKYSGEGLKFNWDQDYIDSSLVLPSDTLVYFSNLGIDLHEYKSWDIIKMTQNYFKVILKYVVEGTSGLLIHCISGWDRTPLFVSLLRLSLWADGKIHQSLSPIEMLYLTLGYDWYLFGHCLPDRLKHREEVLYFCFYVLKYLTSQEFSLCKQIENNHSPGFHLQASKDAHQSSSSSSSSPNKTAQDSSCSPLSNVQSQESCNNGNVQPRKDSLVTKPDHFALESNLNSDTAKHTPPPSVPVPIPNRDRSESLSSGCGSWQMVTEAGSVKESMSSKTSTQHATSVVEANQNSHIPSFKCLREEKLERVHSLFFSVYSKVLGKQIPRTTASNSLFYVFARDEKIESLKKS